MHLEYDIYLDKILGGWIGKSAGGAIGARFEGFKGWIEIDREKLFPEVMPPNDDLDLQVLWLSVLEKKGLAVTSNDLADAWLEWCWYPFNEYGNFRRNYRLGIKPPYSGHFHNEFFDTGMGCPIRSEIWGYVFPGAPDLAAHYASLDGVLDHSEQSVGGEKMLAAMASLAFFIPDVRRLIDMTLHYLPPDTTITRLAHAAVAAYDQGLTLGEARTRLLALEGHPEACDARLNVPYTLLALLYARNDMTEALLDALRCGYDTDCTCATATALVGQILGASRIPAELRDPVGNELVMGIEYRRKDLTLTALARDTARLGAIFAEARHTGVIIQGAPALEPLPAIPEVVTLKVDYLGTPQAIPGEPVPVRISALGPLPDRSELEIRAPKGWEATPDRAAVSILSPSVTVTLRADPASTTWQQRNVAVAKLSSEGRVLAEESFGLEGAAPWAFLGVYFDPYPITEGTKVAGEGTPSMTMQDLRRELGEAGKRLMPHHFVRLDAPYVENEPDPDVLNLYARWSRILGRPAVVWAHGDRIDPSDLVGLQGANVVYLAQDLIVPEARTVNFVVGNNDGYRIYVNGELIAEQDECTWWSPYNNVHVAHLRQGANRLVLKLCKRGDRLDFTLGVREWEEDVSHNRLDWHTDLRYTNPLTW